MAHYLAGLLWVTGAAACAAMAAAATVSHDALRRLLIGEPLVALVRMIALTMVNRSAGYLVLDDDTLDKTGEKIAGIAWLRSSSLGKKVLALNPVVMGWTDGEIFVPLFPRRQEIPVTSRRISLPRNETSSRYVISMRLADQMEIPGAENDFRGWRWQAPRRNRRTGKSWPLSPPRVFAAAGRPVSWPRP